jgi:protein-L-isoaspartate O-methyltransferase
MKVLEIGTGSGYGTALIAEMVGAQELVTSLDWQPDLVKERQKVLAEAGYGGFVFWLEMDSMVVRSTRLMTELK